MQIVKLHCKNHSRFRLGLDDLQSTVEIIHSDTLFNGLINCYCALYGNNATNSFIENWQQHKIAVSSAFYFIDVYKSEKKLDTILFFPKPFLRKRIKPEELQQDLMSKKTIKKLKYLSEKALITMLGSVTEEDGDWLHNIDLTSFKTINNEFAIENDELADELIAYLQDKKFRLIADSPKVSVERDTNKSSNIYYQSDVELHWIKWQDFLLKPGFFFLLKNELPVDEKNKLIASLRLLAEEGIGGERSAGCGSFTDIKIDDYQNDFAGKLSMTLALMSPATDDNLNNLISYQPIIRGGYVGKSAWRKPRLRLMREGAILSAPFKGRLVNVTPKDYPNSNNIYHNGINFSISFGA